MRRRGPLAAFFVLGVFWGGWAALVPAIQTAVGASKGELGLTLLFVAVGSVPAMLLAGHRLRPPRPARPAVADRSVRVPPHCCRPSPIRLRSLAVCLFAVGVASGSLDVAMNGAVSELEAQRSTRMMQLAHGLYSAGVLVGALSVGLARELGAGRLAILGGIAVVILAAATLNLQHEQVERRPATRRGPRLSRAAIPLGIACAAALVIEGGMENWGAIFLERDLDAGPAVSALAPAAFGGAMMLGRFWGQSLERRLGDTVLLSGSFGVALSGLVVAALAPNIPVAVAGFFIGGAGISIAAPTLFGAGGRNADPQERGAGVATVTTIGYLGFLIGPPIVGGLAEAAGLRASFVALALVAAALIVTVPRLGLGQKPD